MKRSLSIRDLAKKSNIAPSTISQIETGKTAPNLLTLKSITDALNFPVANLFLEDNNDKIKLVRSNDQITFIRNLSSGEPLIEYLLTKGQNDMWAGIIEIPNNSNSGDFISHGGDGEEFVYILEGSIVYHLENNNTYTLYENDTLYHPSSIGHRWSNNSNKEAKIMIVSTTPFNF